MHLHLEAVLFRQLGSPYSPRLTVAVRFVGLGQGFNWSPKLRENPITFRALRKTRSTASSKCAMREC
jgi:hypothetical protein